MARFNRPAVQRHITTNLAGGTPAYQQAAEEELACVALTWFGDSQYYRTNSDTQLRINDLVSQCGTTFLMKLALFVRHQAGMRSSSHVIAAAMAPAVSGKIGGADFYNKIIRRPDDMMEIASLMGGKLTNAQKKGFAQAFERMDTYQLSKYRGEGKEVKLVDVLRLSHPAASRARHPEALTDLVKGEAKQTETWEAQLSAAGSDQEAKSHVWQGLIREGKLGYLAMLRNLRNIHSQTDHSTLLTALEYIKNQEVLKKSRVFPFQIYTSYVANRDANVDPIILDSLSEALDECLCNIPPLPGHTVICLDTSGSMGYSGDYKSHLVRGAVFASALYKTCESAELISFGDRARRITETRRLPITNMVQVIASHANGGGTDFSCAYSVMSSNPAARIIWITDMQGWMDNYRVAPTHQRYCNGTASNPRIYEFNMAGYGTSMFPTDRVYLLAGFSEEVYNILPLLDQDRKALLNKIGEVEL